MKTANRRCSQCMRPFVPEPRVRDRQVTCGAASCQRARHAYACREWRVRNPEVVSSHYGDTVKAFREQQPDYQRRWRLGQRLREIREKTSSLGGGLLTSLRALLGRTDALAASPARPAQTGVLAADLLDVARAALRDAVAAIEQLEASVAALRAMRF